VGKSASFCCGLEGAAIADKAVSLHCGQNDVPGRYPVFHLLMPPKRVSAALSDEELGQVAGGGCGFSEIASLCKIFWDKSK